MVVACGIGASAVCVAGVLTGRTERKVPSRSSPATGPSRSRLPGGKTWPASYCSGSTPTALRASLWAFTKAFFW